MGLLPVSCPPFLKRSVWGVPNSVISFPVDVALHATGTRQLLDGDGTQSHLVHLVLTGAPCLSPVGCRGAATRSAQACKVRSQDPVRGFLLVLERSSCHRRGQNSMGPPGGKSGCYDHNIPVYQAPTTCPVLSGLLQRTKALLTLRKPPTLSMEDGFHCSPT